MSSDGEETIMDQLREVDSLKLDLLDQLPKQLRNLLNREWNAVKASAITNVEDPLCALVLVTIRIDARNRRMGISLEAPIPTRRQVSESDVAIRPKKG